MHDFKIVRNTGSLLEPRTLSVDSEGFSAATLIDGRDGSVHVELSLCELAPGGYIAGHLHPFEESFFILEGSADIGIGSAAYHLKANDFGFSAFATPHAWHNPSDKPVRWYRIRSPQPRLIGGTDGTYSVADYAIANTKRDINESDPTCLYVGHFDDSDMSAPGTLSMPGYHGTRVNDVACRMMIDDVKGAVHHTNFMIQFTPRPSDGLSGTSHFHDFEEAYFLMAGEGEVTLEGQTFTAKAGDLVWEATGTMHGWVNHGTEPLRFIELQAPRPPFSNAIVFEEPWRSMI